MIQVPDQRYVDRFYLAAEAVSDSDSSRADVKREIYKLHQNCRCVLTIRQDRFEVRIDSRTDAGWQVDILEEPDGVLALPGFGLRCTVASLYRGTPLRPK